MKKATDYSMEEELELYRAMLMAQPQSMFLMDKNKILIGIYNAASETLAGYSPDDIIGNSILLYANDPESPFHQACLMLNSTFDPVFKSGIPLKFQYMILDSYFEATITKISGERILSQVRDISDIVVRINEIEKKKRNELSIALLAGGLTSWSYDVESDVISSNHDNNVIVNKMTLSELLELIIPEHRTKVLEMFDDIIEKRIELGHSTSLVRNREGQLQWADVHAVAHEYTEDGRVKIIIGSQKNITQEYEYNNKISRLNRQNELILNNSNSGLVYMTPDLNVEWENITTVFNNQEVIELFATKSLAQALNNQQTTSIRSVILETIETKQQAIGKYKGKSGIIIEIMTRPIFDKTNELEGIVLRIDDITEKEQYLYELARSKEKAEQSDRLKSAFLANMSHEIRTPLNAIVGFSQLLTTVNTEDERKDYVNVINSNTQALINLINDILDLSKIEAGYINCNNEIFDLSKLINEIGITFKEKTRPNVELICEVPHHSFSVNLDRVRISQVLTNFITNAIKFTHQGHIKIGYTVFDREVKIYVEDTGFGMDKTQANKVFDRFEKFDSFEQGTGLGTSIAKAIVDAYDGSIGVDSTLGVGSTFWAVIPINKEQINVKKKI